VSHSLLIKIGRIYNGELPDAVPAGRSRYQRGAMQLLPGAVPLVVDHDEGRRIGVVEELIEIQDTDGPWLAARCTVTEPPGWLRKGTRASFGYNTLQRQQIGEWERVLRGLVNEVSVLHRQHPVEPRAHVALLQRLEQKELAAGLSSDRPAAGDVHRAIEWELAVARAAERGILLRSFPTTITVR
jgi:hypothetical protein